VDTGRRKFDTLLDPPTVATLPPMPRVAHILEQVRGPGAPRRIELGAHSTVLGRDSSADVVVESAAISRRHVHVAPRDGEYRFEDLGSSNGVLLNRVRTHAAVLRHGDVLQIGEAVFLYHEGS
jgi:pSer/pThr/pTyr-binding forkhead associated (FHA) protein